MIDVFVGGMLAAHFVVQIKREFSGDQLKRMEAMFTLATLMFAAVYFLCTMFIGALRYENAPNNLSRLQMHTRKFVIIAFAGAVGCSVFAHKWLHMLLGNPVTRFVSVISYQVYMWHGWIALRLKEWRIPEYATERPMDDLAWRWPYMLTCIALSLAIAVFVTYCIERPISNFCLSHTPRWARAPKKKRVRPAADGGDHHEPS